MKMYQINEDDLKTLEELVPQLCEVIETNTTNADRTSIRQVKRILSDVRWNYQPHSDQEKVE